MVLLIEEYLWNFGTFFKNFELWHFSTSVTICLVLHRIFNVENTHFLKWSAFLNIFLKRSSIEEKKERCLHKPFLTVGASNVYIFKILSMKEKRHYSINSHNLHFSSRRIFFLIKQELCSWMGFASTKNSSSKHSSLFCPGTLETHNTYLFNCKTKFE